MHITELTSLSLIVTPSLVSGVTLAAETNTQSNNSQASSSVDTGQVASNARENVAPNNIDNGNVNSGGTMLYPSGSPVNHERMTKDEMHKNTMCKDGRCLDVNKEVRTGNSINNDTETKTDSTTQ